MVLVTAGLVVYKGDVEALADLIILEVLMVPFDVLGIFSSEDVITAIPFLTANVNAYYV